MCFQNQKSTASSLLLLSLTTIFVFLTTTVDSKSIYVKLLDDESYPLVVQIRENYSKVNSRSPSNLVTENKGIIVETSSQSSAEMISATDLPIQIEDASISDISASISGGVESNGSSLAESLSYQDHISDMETSSITSVSAEQPEDLMRLKIEAIMRRREEMAHLLENMAINDLNARYGGYVVQYIPS